MSHIARPDNCDFAHPQRLLFLVRSLLVSFVFSSVIAAFVQGFFSFRIYSLSKSLYIPGFTWILSFARVLFCVIGVGYATQPNMTVLGFVEGQHTWTLYTLWVVSAMNDLIIAATLVYWLFRQRNSLKVMRTVALVDKIIIWTIETGVLTGATTSLTLVLFVINQRNFAWLAPSVLTARLFSNSLLASLNSRTTLRGMNETTLPRSGPTGNPPVNIELSKTSYALD